MSHQFKAQLTTGGGGRGGAEARTVVFHQGEPRPNPGEFVLGFYARSNPVFFGDLPFPPPLHSGAAPYSPRFSLGSQDIDIMRRPLQSTGGACNSRCCSARIRRHGILVSCCVGRSYVIPALERNSGAVTMLRHGNASTAEYQLMSGVFPGDNLPEEATVLGKWFLRRRECAADEWSSLRGCGNYLGRARTIVSWAPSPAAGGTVTHASQPPPPLFSHSPPPFIHCQLQKGMPGSRMVLPRPCRQPYQRLSTIKKEVDQGGRGGVGVRLLNSHQGEPSSIPGGAAPRPSHVGIESCRTMPLVYRPSRGISHFPRPLHSGAAPYSLRLTLTSPQDPDVKEQHKSLNSTRVCELHAAPAPSFVRTRVDALVEKGRTPFPTHPPGYNLLTTRPHTVGMVPIQSRQREGGHSSLVQLEGRMGSQAPRSSRRSCPLKDCYMQYWKSFQHIHQSVAVTVSRVDSCGREKSSELLPCPEPAVLTPTPSYRRRTTLASRESLAL
ncbi:hypothetical protein PR048_021515 [Dryococelus australis]|uniref:Uncharacterized protein n=1 Tax=Dryococelus australis TaxID=614101 RepID=A0ABQ9GYE2_9NEOP|nr:hypothetical protein PR048_021515 [Dryococelus australis]